MSTTPPRLPQDEDIIAPIRVARPRGPGDTAGRSRATLFRAGVFVLLCAALTGVGLWWIGRFSQNPTLTTAAPAPPETAPMSQTQAAAKPAAGPESPASPPEPEAETARGQLPGLAAPTIPADSRSDETAEAVGRLIASAGRAEAAGNLTAAQADLQEALRVAPRSGEARAALQRVGARIAEAEFRKAMAEGVSALNAGDFESARARLLKAQAARPGSREVQEALTQAEAGLRSARIESLRQAAAAAEKGEDWPKAQASHAAALAIDPNLQFALRGQERAAAMLQIERRLSVFLKQPDVLGSDAQLENADRLLQEVQAAKPFGPRLAAEVETFAALVQTARTPVLVRIESDNLTEVAVFRVGKLGRFAVRELNLRPGAYTVVGARDGFQDVRRELVVRPGPEPIRITVICNVKV